MSPEQCRGTGDVDHRADLYSIGCIFYELICGRPPFTSEAAGELIGAHLYVEPEPPSKHTPTISADSEKLILALLAKDHKKRPQSARELVQRFQKLAQAHGWITNTSPSGVTAQSFDGVTTPGKRSSEVGADVVVATDHTLPSVPGIGPGTPMSQPSLEIDPASSDAGPYIAMKPTTLTSAASQSVVDVDTGRRRKGMWIAIAGAAAAVMIAGGVVVATRGGDDAKPAAVVQPNPQP